MCSIVKCILFIKLFKRVIFRIDRRLKEVGGYGRTAHIRNFNKYIDTN